MLRRTRKLNRLRGFDYASDRKYFITSCVKDMVCYFGDIVPISASGKSLTNHAALPTHRMVLNSCGQIAESHWYWLEEQYPYVKSHSFVVMPNHIHGILEINRDFLKRFPKHQIKIKPISELIGAYKTTASKHIHLIEEKDGSRPFAQFAWHRSFHDHIIRTETSYQRIKRYIALNPSNWDRDKYFKP